MYANAGLLFRSAVQLQRGVSSLKPATEQAQRECLASVIFAAMSAEAFINEIPQLAVQAAENSLEPGWVKALGEIVGAAEESHASIESKYHLASLVLRGHVFNKGTEPFRDFSTLVLLRNRVVHAKPEVAIRHKEAGGEWKWKDAMARLEGWGVHAADGLIPEFIPQNESARIESNFLAEISTEVVSQRSCGAAAGIVKAVLDAIPDSPRFKGLVETIYRKDFQFS